MPESGNSWFQKLQHYQLLVTINKTVQSTSKSQVEKLYTIRGIQLSYKIIIIHVSVNNYTYSNFNAIDWCMC